MKNDRNEGIKSTEFRIVNFFILKEVTANKNSGFTKFQLPKPLVFWHKNHPKMAVFGKITFCNLLIINEIEWFRKSKN